MNNYPCFNTHQPTYPFYNTSQSTSYEFEDSPGSCNSQPLPPATELTTNVPGPEFTTQSPPPATAGNQATATTNLPDNVMPEPVIVKLNNTPLASSLIQRENLRPVRDVLKANEHLVTKLNSPGTLAQLLAREAIFGSEVMGQCTPTGSKRLHALPQKELMDLKIIMFQYYPQWWMSPEMFKDTWHTCQVAIEQCCGRLRRAMQKKK